MLPKEVGMAKESEEEIKGRGKERQIKCKGNRGELEGRRKGRQKGYRGRTPVTTATLSRPKHPAPASTPSPKQQRPRPQYTLADHLTHDFVPLLLKRL
jgi:hypothetical protein